MKRCWHEQAAILAFKTTEVSFTTEIIQPVSEEEENTEEQKTAGQWWISILVAFAVIAIIVTVIVVTKFTRMMRMKE